MKASMVIAVLVIVATAAFGEDAPYPVHLLFPFQDRDPALGFLIATKSVEKAENMVVVHQGFSVAVLEKILAYYRLCADVAMDNIENERTTKTVNGGPYQRQTVQITPDGVATVGPPGKQEPRIEWDPTHPDALGSGPKKGYVEYPNINVYEELDRLQYAVSAFNALVLLGRSLDGHLVVEELALNDYLGILQFKQLRTANLLAKLRVNLESNKAVR